MCSIDKNMTTTDNRVTYRQGNMLDYASSGIIVHDCNCIGEWGYGIAFQMKYKFPDAYRQYKLYCDNAKIKSTILGTALIIKDKDHENILIGCLFTSVGYGRFRSIESDILKSTDTAMKDLINQLCILDSTGMKIHMPLINASAFRVSWKDTEEKINKILQLESAKSFMIYVYRL